MTLAASELVIKSGSNYALPYAGARRFIYICIHINQLWQIELSLRVHNVPIRTVLSCPLCYTDEICIMTTSTSSKVVLITGANQGIGFEIAKAFSLLAGYHVLMGSRDAQRGLDAAKKLQGQPSPVDSITIE